MVKELVEKLRAQAFDGVSPTTRQLILDLTDRVVVLEDNMQRYREALKMVNFTAAEALQGGEDELP